MRERERERERDIRQREKGRMSKKDKRITTIIILREIGYCVATTTTTTTHNAWKSHASFSRDPRKRRKFSHNKNFQNFV